jgi:hypothetical protein
MPTTSERVNGWHEIEAGLELVEPDAAPEGPAVAAMNAVHRAVTRGRRDVRSMLRIIRDYGIANDAGISDAIAYKTIRIVQDAIR